MEIRHLESFVMLSKLLKFRQAAKKLNISQPGLSNHIRLLEAELKVVLFERDNSVVRLTEAGKAFRSRAKLILHEIETAKDAISAGTRTSLRVGFLSSFRGLFARAVKRLHDEHPEIRIMAKEGVSRIEEHVLSGRLDIGLTYGPLARDAAEYERVGMTTLSLAVNAKSKFASHDGPVNLHDLKTERFAALRPRTVARAAVDVYFASHQFVPNIVLEANVVSPVLSAVRADKRIVAVLPAGKLSDRAGLSIAQLHPEPPSREVILIWRKVPERFLTPGQEKGPLEPAAEAFRKALHDEVTSADGLFESDTSE